MLCLLEELVRGNTREEMASQNVCTNTYIVCLCTICLCVRAILINTHTYTGIGDVSTLKIKSRGDVYMMHCRAVCSVTDNSAILPLAFRKSVQIKVHVFITNHMTSVALLS